MRLIFIILLFPLLAFGQKKENITGTWILDKVYTLYKGEFILYDVEKHPYDTIKINEDNTFEINCYQINRKIYPSKEERWTIVGNWKYRKNHLHLINRTWTLNKDKIEDTKNKVQLIDNILYIHFGNIKETRPVYVKYDRLN